jgi:hypothetical protein
MNAMNKFRNGILVVLAGCLVGCGSSADELMKEQIQKFREMADRMEKTGQPLSPAEERALNEWMEAHGRKWQALNLSKEDNRKLLEKYAPEMEKLEARMRQAWEKMPPGSPSGPFAGMPGAMQEASPAEPAKPVHERAAENARPRIKAGPEELLKPGERMKLEFAQQFNIQAFRPYGNGLDYTNSTLVFAPGPVIRAVRPRQKEHQGALSTYDLAGGKTTEILVPQPAGFSARYAWESYFTNPILAVNPQGDLLCWWTREYNGDHVFAQLTQGADAFTVHHASFFLEYPSRVAWRPNGGWYLIQAVQEFFNIYRIQPDMKLTPLDRIKQSSTLLDARFISNDELHILCSGRELRCIDFDVRLRRVLPDRKLLMSEQSIGAQNGALLQSRSGALHYIWGIEDLTPGQNPLIKKPGSLNGLYYKSGAGATAVKVGAGSHHRAATRGDDVVICYTQESTPNIVYFRVIRQGASGPITELKISEDRTNNLWSEYMVLQPVGDRVWFVNTLTPNTLDEFKLVDSMPGA